MAGVASITMPLEVILPEPKEAEQLESKISTCIVVLAGKVALTANLFQEVKPGPESTVVVYTPLRI